MVADEALRALVRSLLEEPTHVSTEIYITIPEVALHLTYDVALVHHLVLAVHTLDLRVCPATGYVALAPPIISQNRPPLIQVLLRSRDLQVNFYLGERSIQNLRRSNAVATQSVGGG